MANVSMDHYDATDTMTVPIQVMNLIVVSLPFYDLYFPYLMMNVYIEPYV